MSQKAGNDFIYFRYDTNGTPIGFVYNDTQYLYMTNQLGDVIGITDAQGKELVEYEYDEWGSMLDITLKSDDETVSTLAELNPLRYRGYYYDNETGMYYLQSRYYNPEWGRFISADDFSNIDTSKKYFNMNAYIYCWNCPISFKDDKGTAPTISIDIEAFISFVKTTNDKITDKLTTRFQNNIEKLQNRFDSAVEKARFYFYNPDVLLSRILSTITGLDIKIEFKVLKWLKEHDFVDAQSDDEKIALYAYVPIIPNDEKTDNWLLAVFKTLTLAIEIDSITRFFEGIVKSVYEAFDFNSWYDNLSLFSQNNLEELVLSFSTTINSAFTYWGEEVTEKVGEAFKDFSVGKLIELFLGQQVSSFWDVINIFGAADENFDNHPPDIAMIATFLDIIFFMISSVAPGLAIGLDMSNDLLKTIMSNIDTGKLWG